MTFEYNKVTVDERGVQPSIEQHPEYTCHQTIRGLYHMFLFIFSFLFQLHSVCSRVVMAGRKPIIKNLRSPLPAKFRRYRVSSCGTQPRTSPRHQSKEMKIHKVFNFLEWEPNPQPVVICSHTFVPLRHNWPHMFLYYTIDKHSITSTA